MRRRTAVAVLLLAFVTAPACGEDSTEPSDSASDAAMADVCGARDDIEREVEQLRAVTPSPVTAGEVVESLQAIASDLRKIGSAQGELTGDHRSDVRAANEAFATSVRDAVAAVGEGGSPKSAAGDSKAALQELEASYRSTLGTLDCS